MNRVIPSYHRYSGFTRQTCADDSSKISINLEMSELLNFVTVFRITVRNVLNLSINIPSIGSVTSEIVRMLTKSKLSCMVKPWLGTKC